MLFRRGRFKLMEPFSVKRDSVNLHQRASFSIIERQLATDVALQGAIFHARTHQF